VNAIERAVLRPVGRGIEALAPYAKGHLARAAESLLSARSVVIVTGFPIARPGLPPVAETDGPVGAAQLAAALRALRVTVRVLTDAPCAPVVGGALTAAGLDVPLDVAPPDPDYRDVTHMVAIERPGPSPDGVPRTMRGADMSGYTAPLEHIYTAGPWFRIGVGDGGNELGLGGLPAEAVAKAVPRGADIRCTVPADAVILGSTSNWATAGLVTALALSRPDLTPLLDPDWSHRILDAIVAYHGAIDGLTGQSTSTVDGLTWPHYAEPLTRLYQIASQGTDS
jgi:hypothetical protein